MTERFIMECKQRLLKEKEVLLNRIALIQMDLRNRDFTGDEADQSLTLVTENTNLSTLQCFHQKLFSIESALARIETGVFGFCSVTQQPIEFERLQALPWTDVSIEGAEVQEAKLRREGRSRSQP